MDGWIKIHRELLDKPIWLSSTPEQKAILLGILLMVSHEEKKLEGKESVFVCKPGQIITSLEGIRKILGKGISIQNIRSALLRFEKLNFLTSKSTKHPTMLPTMSGRLITVCNWEYYQSTQQCDQQGSQQGFQQENQQQSRNKYNIYPPGISKDIPPPKGDVDPVKEKKPRKKKEKPEVEKENTLFSSARKIFEARYHRETKEQYYWTAKDAGSMTSLLKALKFQREQKGLSNDDDTEVLAALTTFINSAVKNEWIRNNLSVPVLFSKFNEIVARAKEERKNRYNGTTGENTDNETVAQPSGAAPKDYSARF